jgi:hypothetical protein
LQRQVGRFRALAQRIDRVLEAAALRCDAGPVEKVACLEAPYFATLEFVEADFCEEDLGAADWSRELQALGHTVRLMPPAYVKPYVKRQKNDAADAEAICEAVQRPNMRFVPTKSTECQAGLMLHRNGEHAGPPGVRGRAEVGLRASTAGGIRCRAAAP